MITIKEIAKKANVSEGTVDRVIHNRGGVSPKTKERVQKILEAHNYRINPIASALASKKKYKIASLLPNYDTKNNFWEAPYLGLMQGREEVENYGIEIDTFHFDQLSPTSFLEQFEALMQSEPNAVILVPMFSVETQYATTQLDNKNVPYLFLNIDLDGFNNLSFLGQDAFQGGFVAGKLMGLSLGKGEACMVIQTSNKINNNPSIARRIEGFQQFLKINRPDIIQQQFAFNHLDDPTELEQILTSFLEAHPRVKGIFVPSSRAAAIVSCINQQHLSHLSILGFDTTKQNIRLMQEDKIQFLISQKPFNQGYDAVRILANLILYKKVPAKKLFSPIQIIMKENLEHREINSFQQEILV